MGATLLVFANKTDIAGSMSDEEVQQVSRVEEVGWQSRSMAHEWQGLQLNNIQTHQWKIFRCSAITGDNLENGIEWIVQDAKDRLFLY